MDKLPLTENHPEYDNNYVLSNRESRELEREQKQLEFEKQRKQELAVSSSLNAVTTFGKKASAFLNDGIFGAIVLFLLAISLYRMTNGLDVSKVSFSSFLNFVSGVSTVDVSSWKVISVLNDVPEAFRFIVNPIRFIIYQVGIVFDCLNFLLQFVIWIFV